MARYKMILQILLPLWLKVPISQIIIIFGKVILVDLLPTVATNSSPIDLTIILDQIEPIITAVLAANQAIFLEVKTRPTGLLLIIFKDQLVNCVINMGIPRPNVFTLHPLPSPPLRRISWLKLSTLNAN
ncbi:hypothetical protein HanRHA438_Chr11g0524041 [Helianthus annuus]|nr:hypothetical protein HanRHA438_Chr11g0524041 [Helianthus annuus]